MAWVLLFFVLCVKLLLPFFTVAGEEGVGLFFFFKLLFYIFLFLNLVFEGRKGAQVFLKLVKR